MNREGAKFLIKRGRFVVISAELVPEAQEVEDSRLEGEIREGVEIPWLKEVLKVRIRHHFKVRRCLLTPINANNKKGGEKC